MAVVLELHERRETLTQYSKALRSLGVESDAVSVACAAANRSAFDGHTLVLVVAAPHGDAPSPELPLLLARLHRIPVLALVSAVQHARQDQWLDCGVHALLCTPVPCATLARQVRALLKLAPSAPMVTSQPDLTRTERRVLALLASQPGQPFSRSAILHHIYDDHRVVCPRTVDAHIKNLRRKLTTAPSGAIVRAVYGEGYVFDSQTRVT